MELCKITPLYLILLLNYVVGNNSSGFLPNSISSYWYTKVCWGLPGGSVDKEPACNAGDARNMGLIPGLGRSPGGGHSNLLQYSCLENPTDRGAWWAMVHRSQRVSYDWSDWAQHAAQGLLIHLHVDTNLLLFQNYILNFVIMENHIKSIFFYFKNFNWRLITLQYCGDFCHTFTWISLGCTCVPHPDPPSHLSPHPIPQVHPSAPALSTLPHASNVDWQSTSYMVICMFVSHVYVFFGEMSV